MCRNILLLVAYACIYNLFNFSCVESLMGPEVRDASDDEYPFVAHISARWYNGTGPYSPLCTGAMISNRDIITAEHCLAGKLLNNLKVTIGSRNVKKGSPYFVHASFFYDDWAKHHKLPENADMNEIAIIRLHKNVTSSITPVNISAFRNHELAGREVYIAGWGSTEDKKVPKYLQTANLQVQDRSICSHKIRTLLGKLPYLSLSVFCTIANPYVLVDLVDSGAPILLFNEIVGITLSVCPFPYEPLKPEKVNIHASVYYYRNFLYDIIENW